MLNIISLGAGVQSSTMALMAAHGEITPMPDAAIFADTGAEPSSIYKWVDWIKGKLPFPIYRVQHKRGLTSAIEASMKSGRITGSPPWFTYSPKSGCAVLLSRACTHDFKVNPVQKKVRELSGAKHGEKNKAVLWVGISLDEAHRMKPSRYPHMTHRWPLLERHISRKDCLLWMTKHGYPSPSKSSCIYCPFHDDKTWREIKTNDPIGWKEAVRIDDLIRKGVRCNGRPDMFAHRSLKPLSEIDFRNAEDAGQLSMFGNECEGMCGV